MITCAPVPVGPAIGPDSLTLIDRILSLSLTLSLSPHEYPDVDCVHTSVGIRVSGTSSMQITTERSDDSVSVGRKM